ncbi:MAG: hypothetical protein KatS3mg032_0978 [Cyclobacteriaceae bacterium]|nr:MAG: hypothetical protein KatS3mg032_0978 [Cyclobacteriaceae bacterium]
MKGDRKYLLVLIISAVLYTAVQLFSPKEHQWDVTLYHRDKEPYGTYVLFELLPGIFPDKTIRVSNLTAYEWLDSIPRTANFISVSMVFRPGTEDVNALLHHVAAGGHALVAAEYFYGPFADTLGIDTGSGMINLPDDATRESDSTGLQIQHAFFSISNNHARSYFSEVPPDSVEILATNADNHPVFIRLKKGKGSLWLTTLPFAFTNINLLHNNLAHFAEACLLNLPAEDVYWTEYYHRGRQEPATPLRYVLSSVPLRWAYYITLGTIMLYMFFAARRRQRPIPVIKPPSNTTLEFIQSVANLYLQTGNHKRIAEKRIAYFLEELRSRLFMPGLQPQTEWAELVSHKTGKSLHEIQQLFEAIRAVGQKSKITEAELKDLSEKLDRVING